jgi:EAL and modified HD-GYP domain-containing signal transduction protein
VPSITRYIARQPILTREQRTYGYELLARSGPENLFLSSDADAATVSTIDFSLISVTSELTAGLPAFINCTRNTLIHDLITVLPRDRVVVEILEDVAADAETISACDRLRRNGYKIVLDDYIPRADTSRLLPFVDMVKVDFLATDAARQASIALEMRRHGIRLLAEKVETQEQFELATRLGYQFFQGYFFCRPQMLSLQDIPISQLTYLHVLSLAHRELYDVNALEQAILREPSLCYRLLRYLNSAAFGLFPVRSIRHALSLLGQREIQKWVSVVVVIAVACERPVELINSTLTRAHFCEELAPPCSLDSSEAFMAGIVSLMDAILQRSMNAVVSHLPISAACKDALRGESNGLGKLLQLAIACERGDWEEMSRLADELAVAQDVAWNAYLSACAWSATVLKEHDNKAVRVQ